MDSNSIIPLFESNFNGEKEMAVSARDLWRKLEVKTDFSNWIKRRIEDSMLRKGLDFLVFAKNGENLSGGRPTQEYLLTLDAAKHVSMLEKSDIGLKRLLP